MTAEHPGPLEEDPLLRSLGELPARDLDRDHSEVIRRRGQLALARAARYRERPLLGTFASIYRLGLEPAFVLTVLCIYLAWALLTVSDLLTLPPLR
jgi:hypothetical protein